MEPAARPIAPSPASLTGTSALRRLVLVGVAYAAIQLLLFDLDRAPSWDEAIYLSQVAPGADAFNFTASRARGITLLVAPLAAGGSTVIVRLGLALLASAALVGAFLPWIATIEAEAAAAAASFGSAWTALVYGSEVMPNLWVAFAGVAAFGFATHRATPALARRDEYAAAGLLFVGALLRPFDAVLVAGAAVVGGLLVGRRSLRSAALIAGGAVAGCLPWLIEMAVRYGGIDAALGQAITVAHVSVPAPWERILQYLATADGPTIGPVPIRGVPVTGTLVPWQVVPGLLTVIALAIAAAAGLVDARRSPRFGPLAATLTGALSFVAVYVAFVGGVAPRFLVPALALISIPVGSGVVALWRRSGTGILRGVVTLALVAWFVWQGAVAVRIESSASRQRGALEDLGLGVGRLTEGRDCVVGSVIGAPQLGYAAGCRGRPIVDVGSVDEVLRQEAGRGTSVVVLVVDRPLDVLPPGTTRSWSVDVATTGRVMLYRVDLASSDRPNAP